MKDARDRDAGKDSTNIAGPQKVRRHKHRKDHKREDPGVHSSALQHNAIARNHQVYAFNYLDEPEPSMYIAPSTNSIYAKFSSKSTDTPAYIKLTSNISQKSGISQRSALSQRNSQKIAPITDMGSPMSPSRGGTYGLGVKGVSTHVPGSNTISPLVDMNAGRNQQRIRHSAYTPFKDAKTAVNPSINNTTYIPRTETRPEAHMVRREHTTYEDPRDYRQPPLRIPPSSIVKLQPSPHNSGSFDSLKEEGDRNNRKIYDSRDIREGILSMPYEKSVGRGEVIPGGGQSDRPKVPSFQGSPRSDWKGNKKRNIEGEIKHTNIGMALPHGNPAFNHHATNILAVGGRLSLYDTPSGDRDHEKVIHRQSNLNPATDSGHRSYKTDQSTSYVARSPGLPLLGVNLSRLGSGNLSQSTISSPQIPDSKKEYRGDISPARNGIRNPQLNSPSTKNGLNRQANEISRNGSLRDANFRDTSLRDASVREKPIRDASGRDVSIRDGSGGGDTISGVSLNKEADAMPGPDEDYVANKIITRRRSVTRPTVIREVEQQTYKSGLTKKIIRIIKPEAEVAKEVLDEVTKMISKDKKSNRKKPKSMIPRLDSIRSNYLDEWYSIEGGDMEDRGEVDNSGYVDQVFEMFKNVLTSKDKAGSIREGQIVYGEPALNSRKVRTISDTIGFSMYT